MKIYSTVCKSCNKFMQVLNNHPFNCPNCGTETSNLVVHVSTHDCRETGRDFIDYNDDGSIRSTGEMGQ